MNVISKKIEKLLGEIEVPGDKSISHRSLIFGSISEGETIIFNFLKSADSLATLDCLRKLGVEIEEENKKIIVKGNEYKESEEILDCKNSGTTIRLLSGILSAKPFYSVLTGDTSLIKRPMDRIIKPISMMGGKIYGRCENKYPPLTIIGKKLKGINFKMDVASAQVKSCIILATLFAEGETIIEEPYQTRDHTERMLQYFGGYIEKEKNKIIVKGKQKIKGKEIFIPGDFSSASYFISASLIVPDSSIIIKNVGLNPTRTGFLKIIEKMGGHFETFNKKEISGEPVGDIKVYYCERLKGTEILPEEVPNIIDEIPLIAVLGSIAEGKTIVKGARELRVKESDRIKAITTELKKLGAKIEEKEDGFIVEGVKKLKGTKVNSWNDHRIAMALVVASFIAEGETIIENVECVDISFPEFFKKFASLGVEFNFLN